MARCPKLEWEKGSFYSDCIQYTCSLTGITMYADDTKIKFVCNCDSGHEYEKCPIYQSR